MMSDARLVRSLQEQYTFHILITKRSRSCEARSFASHPAVAGAKTKNFPCISFSSAGGVGGEKVWDTFARKNGKEIFGFASPLAYLYYNSRLFGNAISIIL